jgi:CubicO group peptidase (beta-lactamase class C family)
MKLFLLAVLLCQEEPFINKIVLERVDKDGPGAAVLAVVKGKVIHRKGYGLADLDNKTPITKETLFDLASCSKQFTGIGILRLAEQGKLKLTDDARLWLKELKVHDLKRPIRVSDLAHHTSGLRDYLGMWTGIKRMDAFDNTEALKVVANLKLEFPTGTRWSYSNTNYCLLALIIERISKKSFGTFMHDEIFRSAQLKTASVLEPGSTPKNRASGYDWRGREFVKKSGGPLTTGDGGIFLSLDDWAAFEKNRTALLSKESFAVAYRAGALDDGKAHDYGYGLGIRKADGKTIIGHEGEWLGFRSFYVRWVEDDVTLVILANRTNLDLGAIADEISPHLFH